MKQDSMKKDEAMRKFLLKKAEGLISSAAKYAKAKESSWTLVYLRSAISIVEACRELEKS